MRIKNKPTNHLNRHRKSIWQNPTPFHNKNIQQSTNGRELPSIDRRASTKQTNKESHSHHT